jgi:hypothetical protein
VAEERAISDTLYHFTKRFSGDMMELNAFIKVYLSFIFKNFKKTEKEITDGSLSG